MIDLIFKLFTFFIPNKKLRKNLREQIKTLFYGRKVLFRAKKIGCNFVCSGYSNANKATEIGDNTRFNGVEIEGSAKVIIGKHCQFGKGIMIISDNHNYDKGNKIPFSDPCIPKGVIIGDFCWIGARALLLPGTKIGEGAIIQGGSVVHGEIPPYAIAGGNPAKVFKYRDIEQFKKLTENGDFLFTLL